MLVVAAEEGVGVVGKSKVTVNINVAPRSDLDRCLAKRISLSGGGSGAEFREGRS